MTEFKQKEKKYLAANELMKLTNYMTDEEVSTICGIVKKCRKRFKEAVRKGTVGQLSMMEHGAALGNERRKRTGIKAEEEDDV